MQLTDGREYIGTPIHAEYGINPNSGKPEARLQMEIVDGDCKGFKVPFTANMKNPTSIAYSKRDMKAAGWQGQTIATFVADIAIATQAGVRIPFTVQLASNGVRADGTPNTWWTVRSIGTVGRAPLAAAPLEVTESVDTWFADAEHNSNTRTDEPAPF